MLEFSGLKPPGKEGPSGRRKIMSSGRAQALRDKSSILSSLAAHRLKILAPAALGTKDCL